MAFRSFFSKVGTTARDYANRAEQAWKLKHWTSNANPLERMLCRFDAPESVQSWHKYCDSDIGGKSKLHWSWDPAAKAIFEGSLSLEIPSGTRIIRSGYASVMSPKETLDLSEFDALEIMAKGDGRIYVVNMAPDVFGVPHVLFQCALISTKTWTKHILPFSDFVMTIRGYEAENPVGMSVDRVNSLGLLMAERRNGPFRLEIDYVKALNTRWSRFGRYTGARRQRRIWLQQQEAVEDDDDDDDKKKSLPPSKIL